MRLSTDQRGRRGYALLAVIVFTILILSGATIVLVLARDKAIATIKDKQSTEAYGVALAGINWFVANVDDGEKKDIFDLATGAIVPPYALNGKNLYLFNADDPLGGVPGPLPARGSPSADWTPVGTGHFGMTVTRDPLNQLASAVVRAIGVVGQTQLVLETNLTVNLAAVVPSGFVGCFQPNTDMNVQLGSGPQDYLAIYRFDGNGGAPLAFEFEHNRFNGLSRNDGANPAIFAMGGLPQGRQWRGTQSLGAQAAASGGGNNKFGGVQATQMRDPGAMAPILLWERNPALANDPRLVDVNSAQKKGLGLSPLPSGVAAQPADVQWATNPFVFDGDNFLPASQGNGLNNLRPVPLIAYDDAMEVPSNLVFGEAEWNGRQDQEAAAGFYGCHTTGGGTDPEIVVQQCLGATVSAWDQAGGASSDPNYQDPEVQMSGVAWGVIQSVMRHCTGSGDNIDQATGSPWRHAVNNPNGVACEAGFDHLQNVAACLVVPRSTTAAAAGPDDNNEGTNRGTNAARDALANLQSDGATRKIDDDFMGCHPGCLIAVDAEDDNAGAALQDEDRPFRSSCINLDPTKATTYGPTAYPALLEARALALATPLAVNVSIHPNQLWKPTVAGLVLEVGNPATLTTPKILPGSVAGRTYNDWTTFQSGLGAAVLPAAGTPATFFDNATVRVERVGGAVSEVGSPQFITRLDMTDRGPLGTCEQNCLAYGWGKDVTYGAHRTDVGANPGQRDDTADADGDLTPDTGKSRCAAKVPCAPASATCVGGYTYEVCNLDYDRDGFLDRKSYAFASSYREECADPHDGIAWAPAVNINDTQNTNIAGAGCVNDLPSFLVDADADTRTAASQYVIKEFCGSNSEQTLNEAIDALMAASTEITPAALNKSGPTLNDGSGWFGGARCHMGADVNQFAGHPTVGTLTHAANMPHTNFAGLPTTDTDRFGNPDYWIEDYCPDPVVLHMKASATVQLGDVCGCGVLIFDNNQLILQDGDHFLWRGIIVWNVKDSGGKDFAFAAHDEDATFVVEGSMIAYGGGKMTFLVDKDVADPTVIVDANTNDGHVKLVWRLNEQAISDALSSAPTPLRALRRVR